MFSSWSNFNGVLFQISVTMEARIFCFHIALWTLKIEKVKFNFQLPHSSFSLIGCARASLSKTIKISLFCHFCDLSRLYINIFILYYFIYIYIYICILATRISLLCFFVIINLISLLFLNFFSTVNDHVGNDRR